MLSYFFFRFKINLHKYTSNTANNARYANAISVDVTMSWALWQYVFINLIYFIVSTPNNHRLDYHKPLLSKY